MGERSADIANPSWTLLPLRRIIGGMNLRGKLRERRQRKARKRYEREKAARRQQGDFEKDLERVKGVAGPGSALTG